MTTPNPMPSTQTVDPAPWYVLHPFNRPGWQPALIALSTFLLIGIGVMSHLYITGSLPLVLSRSPEGVLLQVDIIIVAILSAAFCYLTAVVIYQHRLYAEVLNGLYPAMYTTHTEYAALVRNRAAPSQRSMLVGALAGIALSNAWLLFDPRVYQGEINPWSFSELGPL